MIIETVKLTKLYRTGAGCREISLVVAEGQIFGLLGPNGAGKSTLVKMLVGLILPTSGEASLLGRPLGDVATRRSIGYLPENFRYHDWLSAREVLRFHAGLARMREAEGRIREVLDTAGLAAQADRKVGTFSKGMQQRLGLAAALLADPDLLFLDEPTSGPWIPSGAWRCGRS
jgi:ABC-2 type transport system ATP-binding protein